LLGHETCTSRELIENITHFLLEPYEGALNTCDQLKKKMRLKILLHQYYRK